MNAGIISGRYATALLRYVQETGGGERVCRQVKALLESPDSVVNALEPELARFMELLVSKGRTELVRPIFRSFISQYYKSIGVRIAHLTTAVPAPELGEKLLPILEERFGGRVEIETSVDPSISGGFVVEVDGYQMDASLRHRIETIRRQFIISNNRLV